MRSRNSFLLSLLVPLLLAVPARAATIRVDWSVDAVGYYLASGTIPVAGSFGEFEVAAFPAAVPLSLPFPARATGWGPGGTDDVYSFDTAHGMAFEFTGPSSGELRDVSDAGDGVVQAYKLQCSVPPGPSCPSGTGWLLSMATYGGAVPAELQLSAFSLHSGVSSLWRGPLQYSFTVVPEPASVALIAMGLVAVAWGRRTQR